MESAKEKWGWLPKSKITGDAVSPKEKWPWSWWDSSLRT